MKVLLLADFGAPYYPSLRDEHPGHELIEAYAHESIRNEVASAEVVFGYLTAEQFHAAKKLKWIHTLDAGMEGLFRAIPGIVDTDVTITNSRGAGAPMVC